MGWRRGFRMVLKGGCAVVRAARTYELEVTLPGGGVQRVAVTEKRVRRLNLRVRADGSVALSVPAGTAPASARSFLEHSAAWLERALARSVRKRAEAGAAHLPHGCGRRYAPPLGQARTGHRGARRRCAAAGRRRARPAHRRPLPPRGGTGAAGRRHTLRSRPRGSRRALERAHHGDALGLVYACHRVHPHVLAPGGLPARLPGFRSCPRACPSAGAEPQRALPRTSGRGLPWQPRCTPHPQVLAPRGLRKRRNRLGKRARRRNHPPHMKRKRWT